MIEVICKPTTELVLYRSMVDLIDLLTALRIKAVSLVFLTLTILDRISVKKSTMAILFSVLRSCINLPGPQLNIRASLQLPNFRIQTNAKSLKEMWLS